MIRTFETHKVRRTEELSDAMWDFCALEGERKGCHCQVPVPSCWEMYPDFVSYRGKAAYTRSFEAEGNVRLEWKGVSHTADIYIDGTHMASHYNAYTPFDLVLSGLAKGSHEVCVVVDNSFGPDSALHVPNDYQSYGGISRGVMLENLPDIYIKWVHYTPVRRDSSWYLQVEAEVRNLSKQPFEGTLVFLLDNKIMGEAAVSAAGLQEKRVKSQEIPCPGVESWSMEQPTLYTAAAVLKDEARQPVDDLIDRVGFRQVRIEKTEILLNGRPIRIKGFCRHEDHPQFGCAVPYAAMQYDLMQIKDMGANSIRTTHYPNDEIFLDLCDEMGILVWEENHARGLDENRMRNPNFERQCEDCIREMIENHYNHPSIYIWGILNECASDTEYGRACYEKQYELIRSLDPYRPRSSASCRFKTDICFGYPEVVSYNIYPQWYHDTPAGEYLDDLYQWVQEETEGRDKPFLVTEIGAGAIYGYRTPSHVKWSEEYQAEAVERQLSAVLGYDSCSGVYIWQFCDTRVCDSWYNGRPRTMNNKGIVDEYRRPKLSYDIVKKKYCGYGNYRE